MIEKDDEDGKHAEKISLDSNEPFKGNHENCEYGHHMYDNRKFNRDSITSLHVLREDFGRQLELISNKQNTMIQTIGIVLAFASILLIEAIHLCKDSPVYSSAAALMAFILCCTVGVQTLWQWKGWEGLYRIRHE